MRYASAQLSPAISGRRLLAPATLTLFTVTGVYAYRPNPVQGSFAVTARALDGTPADAVSGRLAAACAVTLVEAAALAYGARRLARWRG